MDPRQLREETRAEHEATEALMPLTGEGLTRAMYLRTLEVLEPLVRSWESWAAAFAPAELRPMLRARRRSELLAADLQTLGAGVDAREPADVDWAAVVGAAGSGSGSDGAFQAGFLGALYVMEGSTLGGRYIARHVESVLGLEAGVGDAYFQGHGEATGAMWREVTAEIAGVPEALSPVVVEAARRTFRTFGESLRAGLSARDVITS